MMKSAITRDGIRFDFTNYLVFPKVLEDENICRGILNLIFPDKKFGEIKILKRVLPGDADADDQNETGNGVLRITSEKNIVIAPDLRGVRMDVFVETDNEWVNLEMQVEIEPELPKRARLYQAEGDINSLKPGDGVGKLKRSYIIFFCRYDPFGEGEAVYNFKYRDERKPNIIFEDETARIVLNTTCKDDKIPLKLRGLFHYINERRVEEGDVLIENIHRKVEILNREKWRHTMTTVGEYWEKKIERAEKKAHAEGQEDGASKKVREIALKMISKGVNIKEIAEITGLSESEIKGLR